MLDLNKLELEIDSLIASESTESYNAIFDQLNFLGLNSVELSGGYTLDFMCSQHISINNTSKILSNSDFSDQDFTQAA